MTRPPDIEALDQALLAVSEDARSIVDGLGEVRGTWRAAAGEWSVAECFDHLAVGNRVYLAAMEPSARRARERGRGRRGPARAGLVGGWFARSLEPPVNPRFKLRAPRASRPRPSPALGGAFADFMTSHEDLVRFLHTYADIDLAGVRFPNPFIRGIRFSLATGLHVLAAHDRRHLWQARRIRQAAERAASGSI